MTIAVVYGTRPEAIKLFPVVNELKKRNISTIITCTSQHTSLLDRSLIDPDWSWIHTKTNLNSFSKNVLSSFDFFHKAKYDFVIVQGDTNTAFSTALAAFNANIPIAHVEAGLRTYDLSSPYPEEGYRQMIDRIATRLYAPSAIAYRNLKNEGIDRDRIVMTGNTGIDAALQISESGKGTCKSNKNEFVLATLHRRESIGEPLQNVCKALVELSKHIHIVLPIHHNPAVAKIVAEECDDQLNIQLIEPMQYADLIQTMKQAKFIITDSGGIQEEAPIFGVPVLVARENTERPEGLDADAALLVGTNKDTILNYSLMLLNDSKRYAKMAKPRTIYGDGTASKLIVDDILNVMRKTTQP